MIQTKTQLNKAALVFTIVLIAAFFLPWLRWTRTGISGMDFPTGDFFAQAEAKFELTNPFPEYAFLNNLFWLIPIAGIVFVIFILIKKSLTCPGLIASGLTLSLATVYLLFTQIIIEQVGLIKSLLLALNPGWYLALIGAIGIIFTIANMAFWKKLILVFGIPLATWIGFNFMTSKLLKDHADTADMKAGYVVKSLDMIREFSKNDSLANAKYKEQIVEVNGPVSEIEQSSDTSVNVKFVDTTGSYIIFSLVPPYTEQAKKLKPGDEISLKGSCSGGEYSDIMEVHAITFKRSVINKN